MSSADRTLSTQGMSITCPDGWRDASMLILSATAPSPSGITPNLVITREPLPDPETADRVARLQDFVDRQIDQMHTALKDFREVAHRRATAERPGVALTIEWTSNGIPVTQAITYAYADARTVVISTATASQSEFPQAEPQFLALLRSFRMG
ncbi:DcrB-related protein [Ameyamaea chiangmaiensis]|uniref:DcrB-related protein n=1 Tax=Ameyamaea chiangmaiensis TaxID=442969 RepID=A0A850PB15_9PROT|nr:DcrB-related protein [Ameyamaea chiangmaiensis]MBS4075226.1 DcrB-related protein [Ameyamaea chiangmaiensis]NVN41735.1 DcrB-related protein [Ameyamaea chiangmaiensis]